MTDNKTLSKDQALSYLLNNPYSFIIDNETNEIWTYSHQTSNSNYVLSIKDYNNFPNNTFSVIFSK
jgi:hypothetical protein